MKIQNLHLRNFKRFDNLELNFQDTETGLAQDLIVLVGQNGSGKSTVLQAIAAILGTATNRLSTPNELKWPGFDLQLANQTWAKSITIELDIEFSQAEIKATYDYFTQTEWGKIPGKVPPASSSVVKIWYNPDQNYIDARNLAERCQFYGRSYAQMLFRHKPEGTNLFKRVGDVFWYTEDRTTNSLMPIESNGQVINYDMNILRRRMSDLFIFHERVRRSEYTLRSGQRDLFADIEQAYQTIFPGSRFEGPVPRTEMEDVLAEPWFYLSNGKHQYELAEMSGGERAIFPMIFDFANWTINNSVILIDELELHLHPPLQQGLLKALRSLGTNNQFIITTHSDAIADIVPVEFIRRL